MTTTDTDTVAMELWRKALSAWLKPFPHLSSNQAAAAIIAAKLDELRARIEGLEGALRDIKNEAARENGGWIHLKRCIHVQARQALEADHGA